MFHKAGRYQKKSTARHVYNEKWGKGYIGDARSIHARHDRKLWSTCRCVRERRKFARKAARTRAIQHAEGLAGCLTCANAHITTARSPAATARARRGSTGKAPVEGDKGKTEVILANRVSERAGGRAGVTKSEETPELSSRKAEGITDQESRSKCGSRGSLPCRRLLFPSHSYMVTVHPCSSSLSSLVELHHEEQNRVSYSCSFLDWMIAAGRLRGSLNF